MSHDHDFVSPTASNAEITPAPSSHSYKYLCISFGDTQDVIPPEHVLLQESEDLFLMAQCTGSLANETPVQAVSRRGQFTLKRLLEHMQVASLLLQSLIEEGNSVVLCKHVDRGVATGKVS